MREANNAELMRNLINTIELSHKRQLNESSYLQSQLLLETDVQNNVIPAFRHLFESCNSLMEQGTEAGEYSDEEILALVKHYGSIKKIIDAHKNIPSAGETPGATSAVDAARRAIHTIVSRADGDDPVVANPKEFVADKNERLVSALVSADRKGKFKKLADLVKTWPSLAKNPKVANVLTVGTGVLIPLLSAGTWWAAPAAMMVVKTIFDRLQGKSWKQAVAANVSIGAIGSLIGLGAARASDLDQMVANFSQWAERPGDVPGYRSGDSSAVGSATPGEAGDYAADRRGARSFPGEVGYDEPDRTGTGIPPGEAGDYAADRTGTGIPPGEAGDYAADRQFRFDWREHPTGLYTAVGGERIRSVDGYSLYNSFEDFLADNPSLRNREYAEPGEIIRMRADNNDAGPIDSQTSGEAGDYAPTVPIPAQEYTVKPGDNLSTLAQKNNISVRELMAANPQITNPDQLRAGETINIPSETGSKTYDQGVGTASDTAKKMASGQYRNR